MTSTATVTDTAYQLPFSDDLGFCNILFSALGGDGANNAAKLLFKLGVDLYDLDGGYDAKYGSEKKGTATDVSVRFCASDVPVRAAGPATKPHVLLIFHAGLIEPLELWRGFQPGGVAIVNSTESPEAIRDKLRLPSGTLYCLDATRIAAETNSRLNMPLLAMCCQVMGFDPEAVKEAIAKRWPRAAEGNLAAFDAAVGTAAKAAFADDGRYEPVVWARVYGQIGYRNMLDGGAIDALYHNTSGRDNRITGQGRVPHFDPDACSSCGICLTVCSDPGALLWREGRMVGIDERFCKGCMRCVEVCPTTKKGKALTWTG